MRPEDVLADGVDAVAIEGVAVRKGSVGAFLANARSLANIGTVDPSRTALLADIRGLLPALRAIGLFEVMEVRDPALRAFVEAQR